MPNKTASTAGVPYFGKHANIRNAQDPSLRLFPDPTDTVESESNSLHDIELECNVTVLQAKCHC